MDVGNQDSHGNYWWNIKVICGFGLIALMFLPIFTGTMSPMLDMAQALIFIGGITFIAHYLVLKGCEKELKRPDKLVRNRLLYRWVRHPMYFADMIMYVGFALFTPSLAALLVLSTGLYALWQQSKVEDSFLSSLFPDEHAQWREKTSLLIPGLI